MLAPFAGARRATRAIREMVTAHRSAVTRGVCAFAFAFAWPITTTADAQSIDFVLSTAPITFPSPRLANFMAWPPSASGPVTDSVALPYSVVRTQQNTTRVTTVLIRCTGTTGGKPCADIEWRNGPVGPWRSLTLVDEVVEARNVIPGALNDPWSGVLWLRTRVSWDDPAPSLMTSGIALTLSVFRP